MNTGEIKAALRARFARPEWALMFEVADGTGARQNRRADAVAMNLYPSRGLEIHGFEIKAYRGDWLRELKNPEKSAPVQRYCDRWWIIAPPGIVKTEELPPTWGLYEAIAADKIRQVVGAPKLQAETLDRDFAAALLRRASEADDDMVRAAVDVQVRAAREHDKQHVEREIASRAARHEEAKKQIAEIEEITGVAIRNWSGSKEIGRAVKAVLASGLLNTYGGIASARNHAAAVVRQCDEAMAQFGPIPTEVHELS